MAGGQSHALIIVSKAQGWDPTVIPARDNLPAHSIANFDMDQARDPMTHKTTGELPQGIKDSYAEDHGNPGQGSKWEYPANSNGNTPVRRTSGANPMPGGGY